MSNYVPVLEDPLFMSGLMLFGIGFALSTDLTSLLLDGCSTWVDAAFFGTSNSLL